MAAKGLVKVEDLEATGLLHATIASSLPLLIVLKRIIQEYAGRVDMIIAPMTAVHANVRGWLNDGYGTPTAMDLVSRV